MIVGATGKIEVGNEETGKGVCIPSFDFSCVTAANS